MKIIIIIIIAFQEVSLPIIKLCICKLKAVINIIWNYKKQNKKKINKNIIMYFLTNKIGEIKVLICKPIVNKRNNNKFNNKVNSCNLNLSY